MKEKLETKACYGQFKNNAVCRKCVYARSCEVYTKTIPGLSGQSGMISFDHSVCEWMAAPEQYTPGYEEGERSHRDETIAMMAQMLKWIMSLDGYTLELVSEMIAPTKVRSGGVSVAYLVELRGAPVSPSTKKCFVPSCVSLNWLPFSRRRSAGWGA